MKESSWKKHHEDTEDGDNNRLEFISAIHYDKIIRGYV